VVLDREPDGPHVAAHLELGLDAKWTDRSFAGTQLAALDERAGSDGTCVWGSFDRSNGQAAGFDPARLRLCHD
jgi:hypothetical protein